MATFKSLNKPVTTTSQELTQPGRAALRSSSIRNRDDLNNISSYINKVVLEVFKSLPSEEDFPEDAALKGVAGDTLVTHLKNCGNNSNGDKAYWLESGPESRPRTIKETFDYILARLETPTVINNITQDNSRVNDLQQELNCHKIHLNKLSNESLGEKYSGLYFDCSDDSKIFPFTLSTHMYNIFSQLTLGMDLAIVEPYNQLEEYDYPTLEIPWSRIRDRIEYLHQLVDVTIENLQDGQVVTWSQELNSWINKDTAESGIANLSEVGDVSVTVGEEGQVLRWRSGTWSPEDLPADIDTNIERISELIDVNVTGSTLTTNNVLTWDAVAFDESDVDQASPGVWVAKPIEDLITIPSATQKLGNLVISDGTDYVDSSSTLEDVSDFKELFSTAIQDAISDPSNAALIMEQFIQEANKKYRPGSLLHFNGFDKWYSNLGGNTSNLNALNYMPETFSKGSSYLASLTSTQTAQKAYGGATPVPFVFINAFRLQYKELLDPTFRNVLILKEFDQASEEITFDNGVLEAIIGDAYESSVPKLINEIELPEKTNSLAMTSTNTIYQVGNDLEIEYSPNYLLGVSRTDLSKEVNVDLSASEKMFLVDENDSDRLSGEINSASISDIQARVSTGIGNEVQHSGYTKIMCLGPHEIGDNVYLCPEPMLHLFGIKYPYGIVISDTFLKTPIYDYVDKSSIVDGWTDSSFSVPLYEYILNILSNQASSEEAQIYHSLLNNSNLLNNILASPVGFITKIEGMKNLPYIGSGSTGLPGILRSNLSDKICKNLMGPCAYKGLADYESTGIDLIGAQIFAALELGANLLASTITQNSGGTLSDLAGDINYGPYKILDKMLDLKELHLPTIKIQIPGFKYSSSFIGVQGVQGIVGPKGDTGSAGADGLQGQQGVQGEVGPEGAIGLQGPEGVTGPAGSSGLAGSTGLPGLPGAFNAGRSFLEELSKGSEMISGGSVENYSSFQLNETNSIVLSINNPSLANQVGVKVVINVNVDIIGSQGGLSIKSEYVDANGNVTELIGKSLDSSSNSSQTYISNATIPILNGGEIITHSEYTGTEVTFQEAFGDYKRISVDIVPIYLT